MALIGLFNTICFGYKRYALMPGALQGLKIADSERVADRVFLTSLLVAGAIVIAANSVSLLHLGHNEGRMITTATAWHVRPGTTGTPHHGIIWAQQLMTEEHPQLRYHWMVMGAISMWVFQSLYRHFVWWPIHPVGMLLPVGYLITTQWFSVMVGWAIGRLIAKYAGPRAYLKLRPLFLGLVLGDAAARALWVFIDVRLGTFVLPQ